MDMMQFYDYLQLCIVALCPRECVIVSVEDANKKKTLSALLKRTSVMETKMKDKVQKTFVDVVDLVKQDMVDDGKKFDNFDVQFLSHSAKKLSDPVKNLLCCLYQYLKMYEQKGLTDQFKLSDYKSTGFMHIDAAAIDALELFSLSYLQGFHKTCFMVQSGFIQIQAHLELYTAI